jgi:hypothetical protein
VNDTHPYHRILAVSADRGNDGLANQIRYCWGYRRFAGACHQSFWDKAPVVCKIFFRIIVEIIVRLSSLLIREKTGIREV